MTIVLRQTNAGKIYAYTYFYCSECRMPDTRNVLWGNWTVANHGLKYSGGYHQCWCCGTVSDTQDCFHNTQNKRWHTAQPNHTQFTNHILPPKQLKVKQLQMPPLTKPTNQPSDRNLPNIPLKKTNNLTKLYTWYTTNMPLPTQL